MRVAVLNDIHGNLPALDAVLAEVRQERADCVVVGGAVVGPMTRETLDRLLALDVPVDFIVGNCEVAVLDEMAGRTPRAVPEQYRPVIQWTAKQHRDQERLIERWPK